MGSLEHKVAIVTGGGTGIGEAVSTLFARLGASVLVNGLADDPVEEVARAIRHSGGQAEAYSGDVSDAVHAQGCVQRAVEAFGGLDILVNNAGTFQTVAEVDAFPIEDFDYMMRMNVRSVFLMTHYALPHLRRRRGCVICTGSEAGLLGQPRCAPYGGSKGWIHAFTRSLAQEQARYGVRANCVCPGPIDTQWHDVEVSPMTEQMEQDILDATPMGRRGTPEEAARVFAFLAGDDASFVTGALYFVDGGISIGRGPIGRAVPDDLRRQPEGDLELHHSKQGLEGKCVRTVE
ncbi:MAG: SDR family oxidoreductase [Planctomycetaceae bacterium]|nr:SDR family oxidoreductase [Planctomycetaceae bacterium]